MRKDAIRLESQRLSGLNLSNYPWFHERHRVFPSIFENRGHRRILDAAAGLGVVAQRIAERYPHEVLICNDTCPECVASLRNANLTVSSFDLDNDEAPFPFEDGSFDAIIALATIEHLIHVDHFLQEIHRLLDTKGCLYLSAPNYAGLAYMMPLVITGRTFHNPLDPRARYEFYAHVRYFTYQTLLEYVGSMGFVPDTVYLPLPEGSARFERLQARSRTLGQVFRLCARAVYTISPRWASEPIICFAKNGRHHAIRKMML